MAIAIICIKLLIAVIVISLIVIALSNWRKIARRSFASHQGAPETVPPPPPLPRISRRRPTMALEHSATSRSKSIIAAPKHLLAPAPARPAPSPAEALAESFDVLNFKNDLEALRQRLEHATPSGPTETLTSQQTSQAHLSDMLTTAVRRLVPGALHHSTQYNDAALRERLATFDARAGFIPRYANRD